MATPGKNPDLVKISDVIDPGSPIFDPLKALYSKEIPDSVQGAKQFNNLAEFENFLEGKVANRRQNKDTSKSKSPGIIAERAAAQAQEAVRKAAIMTKNAGPVNRSQTQERRHHNTNVFTRMESIHTNPATAQSTLSHCEFLVAYRNRKQLHYYKKGPMSILKRCVTERLRVVVVVRAAVAIRSHCRGYIVAFDKHMNMALIDVDEKFIRPVPKIKNSKGVSEGGESASVSTSHIDDLSAVIASNLKVFKNESTPEIKQGTQETSKDGQGSRERYKTIHEVDARRNIQRFSESKEMAKHVDNAIISNAKTETQPKRSSKSIDFREKLQKATKETLESDYHLNKSSEMRHAREHSNLREYSSDGDSRLSKINVPVKNSGTKTDVEDKEKSEFSEQKQKSHKYASHKHFQPFWPLYKKWTEGRCYADYEILNRHVNQLFIRGDNVVSISIADS